jgi:tRNA-modifying protein YgfZ
MNQSELISLTHLALLDVTGEDAQTFLQSQIPGDIRLVSPESAQISGWCTAKGRLLTTFILWQIDGGYRLVLARDLRDSVAKRLKMFVLRLKVQVTPSEDQVLGLLNPPETLEGLKLPNTSWQVAQNAHITAVSLDPNRCLISGTAAAIEALIAHIPGGSLDTWLRADVSAGLPLVTQATTEHFVPQMLNLDKLGGVSFKKGCYPGQEIVARTHYLGKIKRHLYRVSANLVITPGQEVRATSLSGQSCGSLLTTAPSADGSHWIGLAVLQQDALSGTLSVQRDEGSIDLTLLGLVMPEAEAS